LNNLAYRILGGHGEHERGYRLIAGRMSAVGKALRRAITPDELSRPLGLGLRSRMTAFATECLSPTFAQSRNPCPGMSGQPFLRAMPKAELQVTEAIRQSENPVTEALLSSPLC
jgi:hypothetical protein